MDDGDANAMRPIAAAGDAAAILRPAFTLWLVVLVLFGAGWLATAVLATRAPDDGDLAALVPVCVIAIEFVVVAMFAVRDRHRWRAPAPPDAGVVVSCVLAGGGSAIALAWLQGRVFVATALPEPSASDPRVLGALFAAALLPAVFEELMYRGVVLGRLREVLPAPLAVATQAGLFAVTHGESRLLLPHLAFGCIAGAVRLASRALWPCMLMHLGWSGWLVLDHYGRL